MSKEGGSNESGKFNELKLLVRFERKGPMAIEGPRARDDRSPSNCRMPGSFAQRESLSRSRKVEIIEISMGSLDTLIRGFKTA